jgi:tetratricopeptide (TPR) repeat protein
MRGVEWFFFIFVSLVAIQSDLSAQGKIDSLLQRLQIKSKKELLQTHLELSVEYLDYNKAKHHAKLAYGLAKEIGDSLNMVEAGRLLAFSFRDLNELDSSIAIYKLVLPIAKRNGLLIEYGRLLNGMGITFTLRAAYDKALECHFESLAVMEKLGIKKRAAMSLFNIGFVYYKIKDYVKSLDYYVRAGKIKRDIQDSFQLDLLYVNTALSHVELANYEAAGRCIDTALYVCKGACSDYIKIQAEYARGLIFRKLNEGRKAEGHFLQSYILAKKTGDSRMQFDNIVLLSEIYCEVGEFSTAEKYLKEAERLVPSIPYNLEVIKLYKSFISLHERTGNRRQIVAYQTKYIQLKDSIYNESYTNSLMRVQAEYMERENKNRIASQQQMLDLKDEIIVRQNSLIILAGMVSILLIFIAYVLCKSNMQRKRANQSLDQKVAERTKELESSYNQMRKKLEEEDMIIEKTIADIRSVVATMKGLRSLSLKENMGVEDQKRVSLLNITIDQLSEILKECGS